MSQAIWNGTVIAESDSTVIVEGNHYFPVDSVPWDLLQSSDRTTECPWKGTATYYDITVDGKSNPNTVWQYKTPTLAARNIKGHVAFWHGVQVVRIPSAEDGEATSVRGLLRRLFAAGGKL